MRIGIVGILLLLAADCASQAMGPSAPQAASAGKSARYDCGTYSDGVLVQLPIAPLNAKVAEVTIFFHGERMKATYIRDGLKQLWLLTDETYIELTPTMSALYWDFTGAEEGEERKPEAVFTTCKKRR